MFEKNGLIVLNKPTGMSSSLAVQIVKRTLRPNKIGHLGTLDPLGTGVLVLAINKATKLFDEYLKKDKVYKAIFKFGIETDTLDSEGKIINQNDKVIELSDIENVINEFVGDFDQLPPMYSAKKVNGKKAYELARSGVEVQMKPHDIKIHSIDIKDIRAEDGGIYLSFDVFCSKGTYIRTICDDLGKLTGFGAHAVSLRRIKCGPFSIDDAITEEEIKEKVAEDDFDFMLPAYRALSQMTSVNVNQKEFKAIKQGKKIPALAGTEEGVKYAAYFEGSLVAVIYKAVEGGRELMRIERMLASDD